MSRRRPAAPSRTPDISPQRSREAPGDAWAATAWIAAVALGLRLWHLLEYRRLPVFESLQMDARFHAQWARALVENGWSDPQVFFRAPGYPYFLAGLQTLTGEILWTARLAQILIGTATVVLVHRLARRLLPARWALAAGLLSALAWLPIHTETELLLEPLLTLLSTVLVFVMVRAGDRPRLRDAFLWGGIAGLAAITRPNALLFAPAIVWVAAGRAGAEIGRRFSRPGAAAAGAVALSLLLPIAPVWLHNARHGDPATVIAWQGGINLHLGNHRGANGWSAIAPGMRTDWRGSFEDAIRLAQERTGATRPLRPSEVSSFWSREVGRFWVESPREALALTARKALLFWSATEIRNNEDPEFYRSQLLSLRFAPVSFGLLAPWALVGCALAWRRGPRFRLLVLFTAAWFLSILPFFVCSRYRLPVVPLLPVFALLTLQTAWGWRRGRAGAAAGLGGAVALLYALLLPPKASVKEGGFFQAWNNLGDAWSEQQRWDEAVAAYRRALQWNPQYVNSHNNLGQALERLGRWSEAEQAFRAGLASHPEHPVLRRNLAIVLDRQGRRGEATEILRALATDPQAGPEAVLQLADVLVADGRVAEARATLDDALRRRPDFVSARLRRVALAQAARDSAEARRILRDGLRLAPTHPDLLRAAQALGGMGMER